MLSNAFDDSARHYLPDDPEADLLYAVKLARACNAEPHCLEIKQPEFKDIDGQPYSCPALSDINKAEMFLIVSRHDRQDPDPEHPVRKSDSRRQRGWKRRGGGSWLAIGIQPARGGSLSERPTGSLSERPRHRLP